MLGDGFIDKDGNKLVLDELHKLLINKHGCAEFLLKITELNTEYSICFDVYEVSSWTKDPETRQFTVPADVELYLTGMIKWDGCSHFWFGEKEGDKQDGYIHLCGKYCFDKHTKLMQALFEFGRQHIKHFDIEVAS